MKTYHRYCYRIPFSETDAMGIVHHSNHAKYLERGRVEFLRLTDMNYASIMGRGMHFPLTEMSLAFKRPLVFDEIILVETAISLVTRVRLNFSYKIFSTDQLLEPALTMEAIPGPAKVTGETLHCCVNNEGRPIEPAADLYDRLIKLYGAP